MGVCLSPSPPISRSWKRSFMRIFSFLSGIVSGCLPAGASVLPTHLQARQLLSKLLSSRHSTVVRHILHLQVCLSSDVVTALVKEAECLIAYRVFPGLPRSRRGPCCAIIKCISEFFIPDLHTEKTLFSFLIKSKAG